MNLESHIFISKLVYNEINKVFPIHINKTLFRAGNILADYSPLVWTHPHYYTVSSEYVFENIDLVCSLDREDNPVNADMLLSFRLGIVCHYITDFFCRAHIGSGIGKKREHLQYEDFLDNYRNSIKDRLEETEWLMDFKGFDSSDELKAHLKEKVEEYRSLPASPERDITMAIENCIKTMVSVIAIRLKQAVRRDLQTMEAEPAPSFNMTKIGFGELLRMVEEKNYQPVLAMIESQKH